MNKIEIDSITKHTDEVCLTLIIPLFAVNPERQKDPLILKKVIQSAIDLLHIQKSGSKKEISKMVEKLNGFEESFDFVHSKDGIGIYLSPTFFSVIQFPFAVNQRIEIENSFSCYELYYYLFTPFRYQVLAIQQHDVRFFNGEGVDLEEFYNDDFPAYYEETYEYAHADMISAHGSTVSKQFEREKSMLDSLRRFDFYKATDAKLTAVLDQDKPLILSGAARELGEYLEVTKQLNKIYGKIIGNYLFDGVWSFGILCWQEMQFQTLKKNDLLISELYELFGKQLVSFGIEDVWDAALLGKGRVLFLEKEFRKSGFISLDGTQLKVRRPSDSEGFVLVKDVVEKLIELVLSKGGEVIFVEPKKLDDFNGVALTLRYV